MDKIQSKIQETSNYIKSIQSFNDLIKTYQNHRDKANKMIDCIISDKFVHDFIAAKLQEAIDKFDLNKDKQDNEYVESVCTSCSSGDNEGIRTYVHQTINPFSKFNPFNDEWELVNIETNDNGQYMITVDNVKGRKHIVAGAWYEPDYYKTDWFNF